MQEFEIEKNIPLPAISKRNMFPFEKMEVGDSFIVPNQLIIKVSAAMITFAKNNGVKFSRRKNRVWRVQ